MSNIKNEILPSSQIISSRYQTDTITYNKIQRHLVDINDRITDDDIRNIKLYVDHVSLYDKAVKSDHN